MSIPIDNKFRVLKALDGQFDNITERFETIESSGVTLDGDQTLSNKTISGSSNTISNIQDSALSSNVPKLDSLVNTFTGIVKTNTLRIGDVGSPPTLAWQTSTGGATIMTINDGGRIRQFHGFVIDKSVASTADFYYDNTLLRNFAETLTNKTISGSSNTFTNIPDSALSSNISTASNTQTLSNKALDSSCTVQNISLQFAVRKSTTQTQDPDSTNDQSEGENYTPGSIWINTISDQVFVNVDSTLNNAVWREIIDETSVQTLENKTLSTGCSLNTNQSITTTGQITGGNIVCDNIAIDSNVISSPVGDIVINPESNLNVQSNIEVNGTQILTDQQLAISNASETTASNTTTINAILTALRTHGLIAT